MNNEELALQVQQGSQEACAALWAAVMCLCYKAAFTYFDHHRAGCAAAGVVLDDLKQESYFAVLAAAKAFESAKGWKFTTYLHFPLQNCYNALLGIHTGTAPRPLNYSESLDEAVSNEKRDITRADLLPDPAAEAAFTAVENREFDWQLSAGLKAAIATLPVKEREAVTLHRLNGCTLSQAGQKMGLSVERVRQLDKRALRLLRYPQRARLLPCCADYGRSYGGTGFGTWNRAGSIQERLVESHRKKFGINV